MASMSQHHQTLDANGEGKCSVPMWMHDCPAGFCDEPAYGERPKCRVFIDGFTGEHFREDGKYSGYVPGLACPSHGGPIKPALPPDAAKACSAPPTSK